MATVEAVGEVRERPRARVLALFVFLALAFPLSWYPWLIALSRHTTSGPNPLGLLLAALIASSVAAGWRGPLHLLLSIVRVRVKPSLWLAAFAIPVAIVAVALVTAKLWGLGVTFRAPNWSDLFDRFFFAFLFVALGEEPAWRGFLLPALQRWLHPILATVAVAIVWAVWHLPLMGSEFAWPLVPAFLASLAGGAFVLTWLYNSARGSVLMPMLMHATLNTVSAGYTMHLVDSAGLTRFWWLYAGLWLAAALIVVIATRGRLGLARATAR
ncbi:MAG TPA: CPBP family intramembrane glutamic endopeptidase [Rhizomicrobium sp.]|jgi:membrane protease YdiL (CAAX protease family)